MTDKKNNQPFGHAGKNRKGVTPSPETNTPSGKPLSDANVDESGHCLQTDTAEHTRPDTGAPCDDGRGGRG